MDAGQGPDPARARDLPEFIDALGQLRLAAGGVSYRDLAKRVGRLLNPPQTVAHTTIASIFKAQRRRLDIDLVIATVRALGLDAADSARWREAYLRILRDASSGGPVGVLRQLPADLATFTGREPALKQVMDAASGTAGPDRAATVVISAIEGMAGVGKTQLAVHAAHELVRAGRFTELQLYVNLRGFDPDHPPADPAAVLEVFLRQLGVAAQHVPDTLEERAAMFRDSLHGRDALVVLDNAADEEHVRHLVPAAPTCLVLVTSRRTLVGLDGADVQILDVFDEDEAVELLARVVGADRIAAEEAVARQIVKACGLLPLAVSVAAARLKSRPAWSLAGLLDRLRGGGLDAVAAGRRSLRPVFDLSYQALEPGPQRMFALLALHPGADADVFAAAALAGLSVGDAERILEELSDHHLIEQHVFGRYTFHDLMRELAREKLADIDADVRSAASDSLCDYYRYTAGAAVDVIEPATKHRRPQLAAPATPAPRFASQAEAMQWLNEERDNLLAVAAVAAQAASPTGPACASDLSTILWRYLYDQSRFREGLTLYSLTAAACRAHGDAAGLANALRYAATSHVRLGDYDRADVALQEAITIEQEPANLAAALAGLGIVKIQLGDNSGAVEYHERALQLHRQVGDGLAEAIDLNNLGTVYVSLGRYELALDRLTEAMRILKTFNTHRHAEVLVSVASVQERLGRYPDALDSLHEALDVCHANAISAVEARALRQKGTTLLRQGDRDEAAEVLHRALDMYLDSGDRTGEGESRYGLGLCHLALGRGDRALEQFQHAAAIAEDLKEPLQHATALNGVGQALVMTDQPEAALSAHTEALDHALKLGDPYLVAQSQEGLGRTYRLLNDPRSADEYLKQALSAYTRLGVPEAGTTGH